VEHHSNSLLLRCGTYTNSQKCQQKFAVALDFNSLQATINQYSTKYCVNVCKNVLQEMVDYLGMIALLQCYQMRQEGGISIGKIQGNSVFDPKNSDLVEQAVRIIGLTGQVEEILVSSKEASKNSTNGYIKASIEGEFPFCSVGREEFTVTKNQEFIRFLTGNDSILV
jgi:hypothetical protein